MDLRELKKYELKNLMYDLKEGNLEDVYRFLKGCLEVGESNLTPEVFATFMKILANLHSNGFRLSRYDILKLPKEFVLEELEKVRENIKKKEEFEKLKEENPHIDGKEHIEDEQIKRIKELVDIDTSLFEEERLKIRREILDTKYRVRIKIGKKFTISTNKSLTHIDITIPADYEIEFDDKIIFDIQNKYKIDLSNVSVKSEKREKETQEVIKTEIGEEVEKKVKLPIETIEDDISFKDFLRKQKLDRTRPIVITAEKEDVSNLRKLIEELDKNKDKIKDKRIALVLDSSIPNIEEIKQKIRNSELKYFGIILTDQVKNEHIKDELRIYIQKLIEENPDITTEEINQKVKEFIKKIEDNEQIKENVVKVKRGKQSLLEKYKTLSETEILENEFNRLKTLVDTKLNGDWSKLRNYKQLLLSLYYQPIFSKIKTEQDLEYIKSILKPFEHCLNKFFENSQTKTLECIINKLIEFGKSINHIPNNLPYVDFSTKKLRKLKSSLHK